MHIVCTPAEGSSRTCRSSGGIEGIVNGMDTTEVLSCGLSPSPTVETTRRWMTAPALRFAPDASTQQAVKIVGM